MYENFKSRGAQSLSDCLLQEGMFTGLPAQTAAAPLGDELLATK